MLAPSSAWLITFSTGNRNALISKKAPSLRVREFINFLILWVLVTLLKVSTRGQSTDYLGMQILLICGELE